MRPERVLGGQGLGLEDIQHGLADLAGPLWSMLLSVPVILGAAVLLLKKQER